MWCCSEPQQRWGGGIWDHEIEGCVGIELAVMPVQDFLKNNRGIDDGSDLPEDYMSALYDRIINDEIKMKVCPTAISQSLFCMECFLL